MSNDPWQAPPPARGILVPPGAPSGYRGYGITSTQPPVAPQPPAPDEPPATATSAPDPEPTTTLTDSVTVAAPEQAVDHDLRGWLLRLPDGTGLLVDRLLLIGRSPDPVIGPVGARLVTLDDPARTVSRSHVIAGPAEHGELLLRNVSTVNALVVIGADGAEFKVEAGGSILLVEAARILVGAYPLLLERL